MCARIGVARDAAVRLLLDEGLDKKFIASTLGMHANNINQCEERANADDEGSSERRTLASATMAYLERERSDHEPTECSTAA